MDHVDRKDGTDTAFDVVLRGYDKRQVDERLRFLSSQLTAAENALRGAAQRVTALQDELNEARAVSGCEPADSNFGARVEKILTLAEDEAREVRRQADAAAAALVEQARAEAERLVAAATDAATRRERSSAHELHQLSRLQKEINADLYRAKEVLDHLFGTDGAAIRATSARASGPTAEVITETPAEVMLPQRRINGPQPAH